MKVKDFIDKLKQYPLDWDVMLSHAVRGVDNPIMVIDLWEDKAQAYDQYTPVEAQTKESWHQITVYAKEPQ